MNDRRDMLKLLAGAPTALGFRRLVDGKEVVETVETENKAVEAAGERVILCFRITKPGIDGQGFDRMRHVLQDWVQTHNLWPAILLPYGVELEAIRIPAAPEPRGDHVTRGEAHHVRSRNG